MNSNELNILGFIVGAAGIGYGIYMSRKMNKICNRIDKSLETMEDYGRQHRNRYSAGPR